MINKMLLFALGVVIGSVLGILAHDSFETENKEAERYCNMVSAWDESGGENGWPPYRVDIQCE